MADEQQPFDEWFETLVDSYRHHPRPRWSDENQRRVLTEIRRLEGEVEQHERLASTALRAKEAAEHNEAVWKRHAEEAFADRDRLAARVRDLENAAMRLKLERDQAENKAAWTELRASTKP